MENIFLKILNLSISTSWLILVILLFRLIFRRLPKWTKVLLWGIVALRLLLPISLESNMSLIPNTETIWVSRQSVLIIWNEQLVCGRMSSWAYAL